MPVLGMASENEVFTKEQLKKRLTSMQYHVTQERGTERYCNNCGLSINFSTNLFVLSRAFTGKFNKHSEPGTYCCIVCQEPLFASDTKFDSSCGWPAFNDVLDSGKVKLTKDTSHGKHNV